MTFARAWRSSLPRLTLRGLGAVLGLAAQAAAGTAEATDCASINSGLLDVELAATTSATRSVKLHKGDVLTFAFRGEADVIGFVTLLAGDGSEGRLLLGGPGGTSVAHTAGGSGELSFRLATVGGGAAGFTVTCTTAARAAGRRHPPPGRRLSRLEAEYAGRLGSLPDDADLAAPAIDAGSPLAGVPPKAGPAGLGAGEGAGRGRQAELPNVSAIQWQGAPGGSDTSSGGKSGDAGPTNLGVKLRLQPAIMVGVLAQFDPADETRLGPRPLSERGWIAGPVAAVQLAPGLSLDARAGWGPLDTGPTPNGHAADRRMVDARLANKQTLGGWRFAPSIGVNYQEDTQHLSELGAQTTASGRVDVRPEIAYRLDMDHGMYVEPKAMIGSFWDIGGAPAFDSASPAHAEMRLKAETGVIIGSIDGTKVQVGGSVEEGAPSAPSVWSGRLQFNVPLK